MIVLDTSVLSLAFRRKRRGASTPPEAVGLRDLIVDDAPMVVPGIVLQELLSGVSGVRAARDLELAIAGFELVLADMEAHRMAAEISTACRRRGVAASAVDCLIAAQTIHVDGDLFAADKDFQAIARCYPFRLHRLGGGRSVNSA